MDQESYSAAIRGLVDWIEDAGAVEQHELLALSHGDYGNLGYDVSPRGRQTRADESSG